MYIITEGIKLTIGGRVIAPSDIDIQCTEDQIAVLLKNKTIKKKKEKGVTDGRTENPSETGN